MNRPLTPGHDSMIRWGQFTLSQLRTDHSTLVREILHSYTAQDRTGYRPLCRDGGDIDTVMMMMIPAGG